MAKKFKRGQSCYLILTKTNWTYKPTVIVEVKIIRQATGDCGWFIVEQTIGTIKHRMTVKSDWITPFGVDDALAIAHNNLQSRKRIEYNSWRFRIEGKTAKTEILKHLLTLSIANRERFYKNCFEVYPEIFIKDSKTKIAWSKIKRVHWSEMAWAIICMKFPHKETL